MTLVVVPVIVMASGQLAGGLSWLAISGEDAPELVTQLRSPLGQVIRAKIEAILVSVTVIVAPLSLQHALLSLRNGTDRDCLRCGLGGFRHGNPVVVQGPGKAKQFPPPPDIIANGNPC